MNYSLNQGIYIFCLLVLVILDHGQGLQDPANCPESNCGAGPAIRFPFRLKGRQSKHCGYPGFDLSCTDRNETLLELPNSVKLHVKTIDYLSQVINISDPENCFLKQASNINLSASPFRFESETFGYIIFNCSSSIKRSNMEGNVPCFRVPGYQVYAISANRHISDVPLTSCTKMGTILEIPYDFIAQFGDTYRSIGLNVLQLRWSEPATSSCETHGGRYRYQSKNDGTELDVKCIKMNGKTKGALKLKIAGITLVSLLLGALFATLYHIHSSDRKEKENQARIEKFLEDYEALTITRYSYTDLKRITSQFKDKLGQGAYGTVFKGKLSNEILVAVKLLNGSTGDGGEFINEVGLMGRIHHVNVVRLVGFCAEGYNRALVYEFLPNESLEKFIFSNDGNNNKHSLGWGKLQDIALGIAKGIEYLHQGCDQQILHFDIKPHNILLDNNFNPKISDFGLAKLCDKDQSIVSMTTARGTMGYIAPEVFSRNFGNVSYKSDIYSYGMLLLEMVGGRKNMEVNVQPTSQVFSPKWMYDHLDRGEELRIRIEEEGDAKIIKKLTIVGFWCIQWIPVDRPCMTNVVQILEGEGDDLPMPPNPFNSTDLNIMNAGMPAGRTLHQQLPAILETE